LNAFCEVFNVISENQTGFRKGHSTLDHVFVLKSLFDMLKYQKKKLYCAFIDYEKAFDRIWRDGMWYKLTKYGISGKILEVVKNMYKGIKSCVLGNNGERSDFFESHIGLRQGENLSPILFALYINDLEQFLVQEGNVGVRVISPGIENYLKLFVLMYADDTVLLSESAVGLQKGLASLEVYCNRWNLKVNIQKTKIVVFGSRQGQANYIFTYNGIKLEIVQCYKYLGVLFNGNGNFAKSKELQKSQAERAMFCLLNRCRKLDLSIDVQLDLFDRIVAPILLYGSEIWGYEMYIHWKLYILNFVNMY